MSIRLYPDIEQGTEQWHEVRRGIITASVVGKLITVSAPDAQTVECPACGVKTGPCLSLARPKTPTMLKTVHAGRVEAASAQPPVYEVARNDTASGITATLAAERITGWTEETAMTADMWRGVEHEPLARDAYSENHAPVEELGFMRRDEDDWVLGYSPDGLVGDDGLLEIKCPRAKTHVQTILADEVPAHYMPQLQAGLLVSGRAWIDFVSFVAGMPLYRKRVEPDPRWFGAITAACIAFEQNVTAILNAYAAATKNLPVTERPNLEIVI